MPNAKRAAQSLVAKLKAERAQKEQQSREMAKTLQVQRNKEGIAMIRCTTQALFNKPAKEVEILLVSPDMVVNFERLRACYQHWLPQFTDRTDDNYIKKAYNLLGGDSFDPNRKSLRRNPRRSLLVP
jgi:hypothetical protein